MTTHHSHGARIARTNSERIHEVDGVLISRQPVTPALARMFTTQPRTTAHRSFTAPNPGLRRAVIPWRSFAMVVLALAVIAETVRSAGTPTVVAMTGIAAMAVCGSVLVLAETVWLARRRPDTVEDCR